MSANVETESARIALDVSVAGADHNVANRVVGAAGLVDGQPILRGSVTVAEDDGRETGDGVVEVGDAKLGAFLSGDVVANYAVANTGRAVGVDIDGVTLVAKGSGTKGGDSTTKGVTSSDDLEAGVGAQGIVDGRGDTRGHLVPCGLEAIVNLGTASQGALLKSEVEVADPVADIAATTDRENDLAASLVNSHIARNPCPETIEGTEDGSPVSLDGRTVAVADNRGSSSYASIAVGSTSVLSEKRKVVYIAVTNRLCSNCQCLGPSILSDREAYVWRPGEAHGHSPVRT